VSHKILNEIKGSNEIKNNKNISQLV